ncbi:MAG: replication protein A [Methanotrichaceae archaeon]|nr:replication protein A [Methanotrichaceae archaeon]
MDDEISEIFGQLDGRLSREEFDSRLEEKVSLMGGLCDRKTAAMLVARELGASDVTVKIGRIKPETGSVAFVGRVVTISPIHEFKRADGSLGRVANLTMADETGTIRVTLWDESTDLIKSGDLAVDLVLKVRGFTKEGFAGCEVNLGRNGGLEEVDLDIKPRIEPYKISEIGRDMGEVNLVAQVLDPGEPREFTRKDGSPGVVRSVLLGDETGKIRLTLWNEQAKMEIKEGESLEVINATSRERYGQVEVQTGGYSITRKSNAVVSYKEQITSIADLEIGSICSISGFVSGLGEVREFPRDDGRVGRVANIYVSDETGRVRVSLWDDLAGLVEGLDLGHRADLFDCQVKSGWNEEMEVSCGWRSQVTFAPHEQ